MLLRQARHSTRLSLQQLLRLPSSSNILIRSRRETHIQYRQMSSKVKTRFLLISDTHGRVPFKSKTAPYAFREPFPEVDVVIHTGDLTMNGAIDQHEATTSFLHALPAKTKIVIPGNHDLTLDTPYYHEHGWLHGRDQNYTDRDLQRIREMYTGSTAKRAGIEYLEEGTRTLRLANGAKLIVYASAYTPEFYQWAFAYPRSEDRFNPPHAENPIPTYHLPHHTNTNTSGNNSNIDVLLTHGPPQYILDHTARNGQNVGCTHLLDAVQRSRPLLHCFGHIHEAHGAVHKTWSDQILAARAAGKERQKDAEQDLEVADIVDDVDTIPNDEDVDNGPVKHDVVPTVNGTTLQRGRHTLFVNASIMDLKYHPVQHPWIVELMLDPWID